MIKLNKSNKNLCNHSDNIGPVFFKSAFAVQKQKKQTLPSNSAYLNQSTIMFIIF